MIRSDAENLAKIDSVDGVDALNSAFYARFPYPWRPESLPFPEDPRHAWRMLTQDLGDFAQERPPPRRIWVAGCGTNQALLVALAYPDAQVVGSDLSFASLELCGRAAEAVGARNLELRRESILNVRYAAEFDMAISTGVIHHTADPPGALARIAAAIRPDGVIELMVYNRYHRILTTAVQKAVQLLAGPARAEGIETEMRLAGLLIEHFREPSLTRAFLDQMRGRPESMVADSLVQPVEYSYTVDSLAAMAAGAGLELLAPCPNQHDKAANRIDWSLTWADAELAARYDGLDDPARWQIANLLLAEASPMLWFYLQRRDSRFPRVSEREAGEAFLENRFRRLDARQAFHVPSGDGYALSPRRAPFPPGRREAWAQRLLEEADETRTMREAFARADLATTPDRVRTARLTLATSGFPFLEAVQSDWI